MQNKRKHSFRSGIILGISLYLVLSVKGEKIKDNNLKKDGKVSNILMLFNLFIMHFPMALAN